jgi:hypothetical protein
VGVAEAADQGVVGFSRFGQGVVARVEVFALFQLALDQVFFGGEFAVEAEELLLFFGEGLEVGGGCQPRLRRWCEWDGREGMLLMTIRTLTSTLFFW